jgi:hypothetical protein
VDEIITIAHDPSLLLSNHNPELWFERRENPDFKSGADANQRRFCMH